MNPLDCGYSKLVGKSGLGDMDISDDDQYLFVTNLYNKSLVIIPTDHPTASSILEIKIPDPGCNQGDYVVGAVEYYNGQVYLGVTCTAETSKNKNDFAFHIYQFNLLSKSFNLIFQVHLPASIGYQIQPWSVQFLNGLPISLLQMTTL